MSPNLTGYVCLVTGATKGIGRGIALQLAQAGAKVYYTGRTEALLHELAKEIKERGGEPHPIRLDHSVDKDVEELFSRISQEQNGKLDVLVNNAYTGVDTIFKNSGKKFWEVSPDQWDSINGVGLRGHYYCAVFGARLMVANKRGLIVNVSSGGGLRYLFNVPYGVGKAGCDRMAADCAHELRKTNVAMVSLWPGPVKTEYIQSNLLDKKAPGSEMFAYGESIEFSGKAVANLAADPNVMAKSGRILMTCDLARHYGFADENGLVHDWRSLKHLLATRGHTWIAALIPRFIRVPLWVIHFAGNKF